MNSLPTHIARALGVPETARLRSVAHLPCPPDPGHRGDVDERVDLARVDPGAHQVVEERAEGVPSWIGRVEVYPSVLVVPAGECELLDPAVPARAVDDLVLVDTSGRDVWILAPGGMLLCAHDGHIDVFEVESRIEGLEPAPRLEPVDVPVPPVATWFDGASAWLLDEAGEAAEAPNPVHRVAAAGVLLRLWDPPSRELRKAAISELRRWLGALDSASIEAIVRDAHIAIGGLHDRLEVLEELDGEGATLVARDLAVERDRLESVFASLTTVGAARSAREALAALDERALADDGLAALLERAPAFGEEHARRVWEREPGAWWVAHLEP